MCFSSRNSHGGKHIFSISSLEAVFPPPAGKLPRHPLRARLGQKISNRKLSVISLYYGRWQYYALGGAGDPGGILRLFLRLRDRILFPEPDPSEKPRGGRRHVRRPGAGHVGKIRQAALHHPHRQQYRQHCRSIHWHSAVHPPAGPGAGRDGVHLRADHCGSDLWRGDPQEPCKGDAGDGCYGGFALFEPAADPVHPADLAVHPVEAPAGAFHPQHRGGHHH